MPTAASDRETAAAVRAALSKILSHPGAVEVEAHAGRVALRGPVLEKEVDGTIAAAASVAGVTQVENRLDVARPAADASAPRVVGTDFGYRPEFLQGRWSPLVRAGTAAGGAIMLAQAVRSRGASRILLGLLATGAIARAATNRDLTHLFGSLVLPVLGLRRSLTVDAAIEDVYDFWKDFSNYPKFMSYIREVGVNEAGGLHWRAEGPAGVSVQWDTVVAALLPNQMVSWKSVPGSLIATEGRVQLRPDPDGGTCVDVELSYAPPLGALGYVVAHVLGFDPLRRIDEDLLVMKLLIESEARTRASAA